MTNREAIEYIKWMQEKFHSDKSHEACDMAIAALKKEYTKADYIMALHKEYGCSLAKAEKAHQKALEYLRNTSMMKG